MKIRNISVYGIDNAIRCSKFPMAVNTEEKTCDVTETVKSLGRSKIGEGHDNFLNGIVVQFDLTFTLKAWTEAQRYHFFDFISSQSTMHRITKFDVASQCNEYVDPRIIDILNEKVSARIYKKAGRKTFNWKKIILSPAIKFNAL